MLAGIKEAFPAMKPIRVLLAGAIDYAGLFPPAALPMRDAVRNYRAYLESSDSWALGRFIVPLEHFRETGLPVEQLSVIVPAGGQIGDLPHVEIKVGAEAGIRPLPGATVYYEAPVGLLTDVKRSYARAKVRTGGVTADLFPPPEALAAFLIECARLRLPFKATAGLHHAVRSVRKLTGESGSGSATMHGFLNLFLAADLAWNGGSEKEIRATLEETSPDAFSFNDAAGQRAGDRFFVSFGSCSFEEPLRELKALGLL